MPAYKIYMRSFAPWKEFGAITNKTTISVPTPPRFPFTMGFGSAPVALGGAFHGDGRGFSLDTASPAITSRVVYWAEVNLDTATVSNSASWCDESRGPVGGVGPHGRGTAVPKASARVRREGQGMVVTMEYEAANPLVPGAPDIDANGEFGFLLKNGVLLIDATITGDQFPACETFLVDGRGGKVFLGGFAPQNKEQFTRLFGSMNKPEQIWFESSVAINVDGSGYFQSIAGGGSGTQSSGPASSSMVVSLPTWNTRLMASIPMPADAP